MGSTDNYEIGEHWSVWEIRTGSAHLPYDSLDIPATTALDALVRICRVDGSERIIGCDANAHHLTWSTDNNERGEHLLV